MNAPTLTTQRLTLRPYEEGDIAAWQRWDTDPAVQVYLPETVNQPVSDKEQLTYLKNCLAEEYGHYWTIVWNETGAGAASLCS